MILGYTSFRKLFKDLGFIALVMFGVGAILTLLLSQIFFEILKGVALIKYVFS